MSGITDAIENNESLREEKVKNRKDQFDTNDKSDSGMDEDSVKTDSPPALDSDSEDEVIVTKKPKRKMIMKDSDEDDDDDQNNNKQDDDDKQSDEDDDKQSDEDDDKTENSKFSKTKTASDVLEEVMNDDTEDVNTEKNVDNANNNNAEVKKSPKKKPEFDSDIFDAEESGSDDDNKAKSDSDSEGKSSEENREEGEDEGFDESSIDPKLLEKLRKLKGAGKTATREGKKRKAKENALNIHSESQRLVRESHTNLPYHQPAPKSLNDFLARASKKQEQYKCLRSVRDTKNAKIIEETLSEKKDVVQTETTPSKTCDKLNASLENKSPSDSKKDLTDESNQKYLFDTLCKLQTETNEDDELPDIAPQDISTVPDVSALPVVATQEPLHVPQQTDPENSANNKDDQEFSSSCLNDEDSKIEKCSDKTNSKVDNLPEIKLSHNQTLTTPKQKILSRLNLSIEDLPKLSGEPDAFISFEEETTTPKNPELNRFMNRFLEHSKKKQTKKCKDVDISIVQKESSVDNKEELKLSSFTYHIDEEEPVSLVDDIPGRKLLTLKEKLQAAMKMKREESRQKRQEMFALENEEGFEVENDEEAILDNEDEMTDGSDTDIEDEEFDKQFGEEEYDEEEKVENPFADDEAEEDGDAGDNDEGTMKLQLDTSDEEDQEEDIKKSGKTQKSAVISDDDESQDIPNGEEGNDDDVELSPLTKHLTSNTQKPSRIGNITLPIEDTQDLYDDTQDGESYPTETQPSPGLNFLLEDSQSQMLDADGFIKVRSTTKQPSRRSLGLEDEMPTNTQDNMDELLGLCSGRFVEKKTTKSSKSLFGHEIQASTQGDMDELLGLCSGVFAKPKASQGVKRKLEDDDDDDEDEEESNASLKMLSDEEDDTQTTIGINNDSDSDNEAPNIIIKPKKKKGFKTKNGIRQEFVDMEAELSGSEYESDEDLDLDDDEDILMEEEGDKDTSITETELRDQVGRAHLKQVIDEDKRELMRLQEMYLADGDLHKDGGGRTRRFRWSNMDEESQQDMFGDDSGGEDVEEENAEDLKWRMERYKREKFLEEQKENEDKEEISQNDESQILKFGKCFLQKKDPVSNKVPLQRSVSLPVTTNNTTDSTFVKPSLKGSKRGSFLNRSKEALAKIADRTKSKLNPNATTHSRKFVFQVISPDKEKPEPSVPEPKARLAHSTKVKKPAAKRPKLDNKTKNSTSSIFKHLEK